MDVKLEQAIIDLAGTIALQADAIHTGRLIGPREGQVLRMQHNVETLLCWVRTASPADSRLSTPTELGGSPS
jgi:hypothetical protein